MFINFGTTTRGLGESFNVVAKTCRWRFFPTVFVDKPKSLSAIGCSLWYRGLALRPSLKNGVEPSKILNSYFVSPTGTHRSLSRVLDLKLPVVNLIHPQHLEVSLQERLRFAYKASKIFAEGD